MRWAAVIGVAATVFAAGAAHAEEWILIETGDRATAWGINRSSVRTESRGPTRAWFIRALPPIGEDSPDYRLSLEAFDCERYIRVTETVADYELDRFVASRSRNVREREEVLPNTVGYALLEAACSDRAHGPRSWSERDFVEDFRRDWEAQNWTGAPPYQVGDLAPLCTTATFDCEIWERSWRGRGLAPGARVGYDGRIEAE